MRPGLFRYVCAGILIASTVLSVGAALAADAAVTANSSSQASNIFQSRCAVCHGDDGRGDGPAASNMNPGPVNFHSQSWQASVTDAVIAKAIVNGGAAVGRSSAMAPNPDLEPAVVSALVAKIRAMGK